MRRFISGCLTTLAICAATPIIAAEDTATGGGTVALVDLRFDERTRQGRLDACELVYLLGFEDHIYRQGGMTALRGSLSLSALIEAPNKPPVITLKVTAFDMVGAQPSPQFAPLHYAFLSAKGTSFAGKEAGKFTCDDGGVCMAFSIFDNPTLLEALLDGAFEINVSRTPNGSDVRVPVNFARDKPETAREFAGCTLKLIEVMKKKFGD